jgi:hypothetical protein
MPAGAPPMPAGAPPMPAPDAPAAWQTDVVPAWSQPVGTEPVPESYIAMPPETSGRPPVLWLALGGTVAAVAVAALIWFVVLGGGKDAQDTAAASSSAEVTTSERTTDSPATSEDGAGVTAGRSSVGADRVDAAVPANGQVPGDARMKSQPVLSPRAGEGVLPLVSQGSNCSYPSGIDGGGNAISYGPENAFDATPATAWRCPGAGGYTIEFAPVGGGPAVVTDVGIIPGYAKTDPYTGVDRFSENHTATEVVWRLYTGSSWISVSQVIDQPSAQLSWARLDSPTLVYAATLTVTATGNPASRLDSTPISTVALAGDFNP